MKDNSEKLIAKYDTFCNVCRTRIEKGDEYMRNQETNFRECLNCASGEGDKALQFHIDFLKQGERK